MKFFKKLVAIVLIFSIFSNSVTNAATKMHAYTMTKTDIYNKHGRKVGSLSNGIVFSYQQETGDYVQFNYYGKKRYVKRNSLVLNTFLDNFIKNNPDKFERNIETLKNIKVFSNYSINSKILKAVNQGTKFKSFGKYGNWYKVQLDGDFGYVKASACRNYVMVDVVEFPKITGTSKSEQIVNYAKKFLGNPYVWGGTSLTSGCDCSGFVQAVYKNFGYDLPRCSRDQARVGKSVSFSQLKPGDLIFYYRGSNIGHVTMYAGNGMCIQARGSAYGIVMTRYDYSTPAYAKRII